MAPASLANSDWCHAVSNDKLPAMCFGLSPSTELVPLFTFSHSAVKLILARRIPCPVEAQQELFPSDLLWRSQACGKP